VAITAAKVAAKASAQNGSKSPQETLFFSSVGSKQEVVWTSESLHFTDVAV